MSSNPSPGGAPVPFPFPDYNAPRLAWATAWKGRGFAPIPLPRGEKKPVEDDWPTIQFGDDLARHFVTEGNLGVADGAPYGNTDIDLDCDEAIRIFRVFAPPTNLRWGRASKRNSHWIYRCDPPLITTRFEDTIEVTGGKTGTKKKKVTLLELRGLAKTGDVGLQTMCPPSTHPGGEQVRFEPGADGEPANLDKPELERAGRWTAAAALLVRHFPDAGAGRHDAFLALSGCLAHAGFSEDNAHLFLCGMYVGLWDTQADFAAAKSEVSTTYAKAEAGDAVSAFTRLSQLIDAKIVRKAAKWLGITVKKAASSTSPAALAIKGTATKADGTAAHFTVNEKGVYFTGGDDQVLVCSPPLEVLSTAASSHADEWGRILRWKDVRGNPHLLTVPMALVGDSSVYRQELKRQGLLVAEKIHGQDLLARYITFSIPQSHVRLARRPGWEDPGKIYVRPDITLSTSNGNSNGEACELYAPSLGEHFYRTRGTLAEWREHIGEKAAGNSRLIMAISTAFAAPLLALTDIENGGFHFTGLTSLGKSTMQIAAGSVYGGGGVRGFVRTWNATANGTEAMCQLHNDACLMLDELKQIDPKIAENVVYMICNAMGKSRMTQHITARSTLSWRLLFLSSGEAGLAEHVAGAGAKQAPIKGGANVRLINIPADAGKCLGAFENIHGATNAATFAETLARASKKYYGTPIRAFLQELINDPDNTLEAVRDIMTRFAADLERFAAAPEVHRALTRFALVAAGGELATQYSITGWNQGDAQRGARALGSFARGFCRPLLWQRTTRR